MAQLVKYIFIFQICLAPLGVAVSLVYVRAARKAQHEHRSPQAAYYGVLARTRLIVALMDFTIGGLGYYLVSRNVFPWLEPVWLLLPVSLTGFAQMRFMKHAKNVRREKECETVK
ncbi:MAG TPA: hypothetical protein VN696_03865 [Pyrinomonadaceae bacterium]|jgi:hypothetical protein|nr:hypothetical protein [Pyrinomonadaceae bacterium]